MNDATVLELSAWLVEQGLAGASEKQLLYGFCKKCRAAGLELSRALTIIDTLHPVYEGRVFRWNADVTEEPPVLEYGRTTEGSEAAAAWQRSVFFHLQSTGGAEYRYRPAEGVDAPFLQMDVIKTEGHTEMLALIHHFARDRVIGEMECVYSYWCTKRPEGFTETDLASLRRLVPTLALSIKSASLARIAGTLVEVYLGRDAGKRVLSGRILRGVAESINAVIWFSDLRGYTRITDSAPPGQIIPLLNDYADAVISAVHDAGGDVLKLIGDGILAIFQADEAAQACACALRAEADLRARLTDLNGRREAENLPTTTVYLGLHIGEVLYGNIGSADRLDFTVVGPAVNETSRIASMCRSADRDVLLSAEFVAAAQADPATSFPSVGRYAFRGVRRPRELFTLEPV